MEKQATVRVTGRGTLKLRPDRTRLTLTLQGTDADYGEVLRRSAADTETLRGVLETLGFARDALKTVQFHVDTVYEGYQDEKGVYRNRFTGYQFQNAMKLEFPMDDALLGRTLWALAHSGVQPEFQIGYTLSDPEAARNALLEQSVRDAQTKAETLAAAAGRALGALLHIDYARGEFDPVVRPMRKMAMAANAMEESAADSYDLGVTPDDISVSDTVMLEWELI